MKRRIVTSMLVVVIVGLLSSCGGGSSDDTSTAAEDTTSATTTTEAAASFECEDAKGKADATVAALTTKDFEYVWDKEKLEFPAGEQVVLEIVNKSDTYHDFTADTCLPGRIEKGKSLTISFTVPDAPVEFVCTIHPLTMLGTIEPE